jgi:hypothetical protein
MSFGKRLDSRLSTLSRATRAQTELPANATSKKRVKRAVERHATYKFGKVRYDGGGELNCIVQDMSTAGARVKLQGAYPLPPAVVLSIPDMGFRRTCAVRWQRDDEVGLSF